MTNKKAKTAAEVAEERARAEEAKAENAKKRMDHTVDHTPVEIDIDDMIVTPQEKPESHVVNQDEATGFDENKQSGRFKSDVQSLSRIKNVYADGEEVVIEVDKSKIDLSIHAAILTDQRLTPKEAVQRALMLNDMLRLEKVQLADRKMVQDIVEATIIAVIEARENTMRREGATYEDIKRSRKKMLDNINTFEAAVLNTRGQAALDELGEMILFKAVLKKIAH